MRKFKQLLLLVISITLVSCHTTGSIKQKAWKEQIQKTTADNTSTSTKATEKTTENKTKHTGEWDAPTQTDKVIE